MSIDIRNGYRFLSKDLETVKDQLETLRSRIQELQYGKTCEYLAEAVVTVIDNHAIDATAQPYDPDRPMGPVAPLATAAGDLFRLQKENRRTGRRSAASDFDFEMRILPDETGFHALVFTKQPDFIAALEQSGFVEEFVYWDEDEKEAGVTQADWEARGELWEALLARDSNARGNDGAFTFEVKPSPRTRHPEAADVQARIPSFENRVERQAETRLLAAYVGREGATTFSPNAYREARAHMKSEQGVAEMAAAKRALGQLLDREITPELLAGAVSTHEDGFETGSPSPM